MSTPEKLIPDVLRCLLLSDAKTGRWNGHCLDLDIATSGEDPDQAWKNLLAVVRLQVENCFTHWRKGLQFRADEDEIAVFEALSKKQLVRREKITFNLAPPAATEMPPPLWVEAAEMTGGVACADPAAAVSVH